MLTAGGINCNEEFSAFLVANPTYVAIPAPEPGFETINQQIYICIDGGVRWFDTGFISRYQEFINFLTANPQYGGLTTAGLFELNGGGGAGTTLFNPGSGFYVLNYRDDTEFYVWFDPAIVNPANLDLLASNPDWTVTL